MIIYLAPTAKSSLNYGSKITGEILQELPDLLIVKIENGLVFRIPKKDILYKIA